MINKMSTQPTGGQQTITATAVSFVVLLFISSKGEIVMGTIYSEAIENGLKRVDRDVLKK